VIEVRSAYVVKAADIRQAIDLWKEGRDALWPQLGWDGRLQQMLHGRSQQSTLVWSSTWPSMAAWEEGMRRTLDLAAYGAWAGEMNQLRLYGAEREVFTVLGGAPLDATAGLVEVRSAYRVRMQHIALARASMEAARTTVWPELGWSGQNQQMLHGAESQSQFLWTSTWDDLGAWERAMARTVDSATFQAWYREFLSIVDVATTREIFRNL